MLKGVGCVLQITLVAVLAWAVCAAMRRWSPDAVAIIPAVGLAAVVVLTACAFVPWPSWWRFAPRWETAGPVVHATDASHVVLAPEDVPQRERGFGEHEAPTEASAATGSKAPTAFDPAPPMAVIQAEPAVRLSEAPKDTATAASWLPTVLAGVLGLGVLAGLGQLVGGLVSAAACKSASRRLNDRQLDELLDVLQAELGVARAVELRESEHLATAATLGYRRPVILLPQSWREWTDQQRRAVLAHELAHVARGDYLACILAQLSLALHYYHPLVHWLVARLRLEQELAADATAAELAGGRRDYLTSLAELALHTTEKPLGWPAHTFLPTRGTFLRRIEMLRDSQPVLSKGPARGLVKWLAIAVVLAGAAVIAGLRGGSATSPFDAPATCPGPRCRRRRCSSNGAIDLTHVINDAQMIVVLRPAAVLAHEQLHKALVDYASSGPPILKLLSLEQLEQLTVVGPPDDPSRFNPTAIIIAKFKQPVGPDVIAEATGNEMVEEGQEPQGVARHAGRHFDYARPDGRTYILAERPDLLARYIATRRKGQPTLAARDSWKKVEKGAVVFTIDMEVVRHHLEKGPPNRPSEHDALAPLWKDSEYVAAGIILDGETVHFRQVAECRSAELAESVADTAEAAATMGRNTLRSVRERERDIPAFALLMIETAEGLLKTMKVEQSGSLVVAQTSTTLPELKSAAASGLATAIGQARVAAHRQTSANNLKQIALGLHNWADTYGGRFPPPVILSKDGKGKVPHSWRVALLPFVGYPQLYEAYNFDEPWDSETNRKVLAQMPPIYRHPLDDPKSTNAAYFVLRPDKLQSATEVRAGAGGFGEAGFESADGSFGAAAPPTGGDRNGEAAAGFESADGAFGAGTGAAVVGFAAPEGGFATAFADKKGMQFAQMTDGMSNIIAVVEAKRDIPWTKPDDIVFDPAKDPPKLGGYFAEGFNAAFCDGAVKFIDSKIDPKTLKLLIMPQDGQPVPKY
jgi:beta-lactamase regulating signal transducer with metallopeptidase domain